MDVRCLSHGCKYARLSLGRIASEAYAVKHSLKHYHMVEITDDVGRVAVFGEDRTIPLFGDNPPF